MMRREAMEEERFVQATLDLTDRWKIPFTYEQAQLCYQHITLMLDWNRTTNLTRITDFNEILIKHILDSLIPARRLPKEGSILDIGTGPGFPGIPLKILHPALDLVLLESNRKKISFLRVLLSRLPLKNASVLQARLEELDRIDHPLAMKSYDILVMRAVHLDENYLRILSGRILRPGGILAWWAGPCTSSEQPHRLSEKEGRIILQEEFSYSLPSTSNPRRLILWRKES